MKLDIAFVHLDQKLIYAMEPTSICTSEEAIISNKLCKFVHKYLHLGYPDICSTENLAEF